MQKNSCQLKLPLNIETIIPGDDSVRLLSQFVEAMDLTDLYSTYERINSVSPRTLLKIVLYSYMNGDYSSRSMELNCKRDINFTFLLEGASAPDHATFARFRSIQAEGSFGDLKQEMQFRRYLSKGTTNVLAESTLLAMARNINKLQNKIQKGRTGTHLFLPHLAYYQSIRGNSTLLNPKVNLCNSSNSPKTKDVENSVRV